MKKKILIALLVILIVIQFFRPTKNLSGDNTFAVSTKYPVPESVSSIMKVACNDCHTNQTTYPWYAEIQPVAWWLDHHVTDGKRHFNFSTFTKLPIAVQNHKLEEMMDEVKEHEMPLSSYTWFGLHSGANLTDEQRQTLLTWAQTRMDSLKANYPADSLKMRRREPPPQD